MLNCLCTEAWAVYKPDSQSTDEWILIVGDVSAAEKWKGGGEPRASIPLVQIVDSFDVFHTGQGSQGILARPSKQELHTIFGTTNEDEIVETILTKGRIVSSDMPHQWGTKNDSKSGNYQTSQGSKGGHAGGR
ncbi:ribosome maturation protein [Rhodotorula diobovata]|uniref:Ribosome maturation protein n=1 Tax=Rhodotorula diobovata TaxID=5288 RepID=A0A5C5FP94_9BASI|nr:ribosome maturation protein [Rhodotorula diobovata]